MYFPKDQLLIVDHDELLTDTNTTINTILDFVGLPRIDVSFHTTDSINKM